MEEGTTLMGTESTLDLRSIEVNLRTFDALVALNELLLALNATALTVRLINPGMAAVQPRRTLTIHKTPGNNLGYNPAQLWNTIRGLHGESQVDIDTRVDGFLVVVH